MTITLARSPVAEMGPAFEALRQWQADHLPFQLHPGDLAWAWRAGAQATADAVRTWSRDGQILAVGFLDEPTLLRLTLAPQAWDDERLVRQIADDIDDPQTHVLPAGEAYLEIPVGAPLRAEMADRGWVPDEEWSPLSRSLDRPIESSGLRAEVVDASNAPEWMAVNRASFGGTPDPTDERWHTMMSSPYATEAESLILFDGADQAVAALTVWAAGPGRPGLIEPLGVHPGHRGHGHGVAATVEAAAALQRRGSSSVVVATPSTNVAAVATYAAAGFERLPERQDLRRPSSPWGDEGNRQMDRSAVMSSSVHGE